MSKEKAKAHFLGEHGHKRLNCGQAVIKAFQERFSLTDEMVTQFEKHGGGKAPEGYCGAFYAAKVILENKHPDALKECEQFFLSHAGSIKCKDIRASRRLTCAGCVEKAAESLENMRKK